MIDMKAIKSKHAEMADFLRELNFGTLGAYEKRRSLVLEHRNIEQNVLAGGYGYRQILELIQNGADAILEAHEEGYEANARILVLLTDTYLYVANTGAAISKEGIDALLSSHNSTKRGNQIGRFGLGFKSLLRLEGVIDIFSRTWGGIRFDPQRCRREIMERFGVEKAPGLRLAWSQGQQEELPDVQLGRLTWAETVVRVLIADPRMSLPLKAEIVDFPAEFLLFSRIPIELSLDVGEPRARLLSVVGSDEGRELVEGDKRSAWRLFQSEIQVTDEAAKADATEFHDRDCVPLIWAVPVSGRREEAGRFWAFFPTKTPTYLPGILNAPWKLNNDRQGLITGAWNDMLMKKAAELVTKSIMSLSDEEDPAKHLDSFPRRPDAGDIAIPLLEEIWKRLESEKVIPDCNGKLRMAVELTCHPTEKDALIKQWMALADAETRAKYVHPSCLTKDRFARLKSLSERISVSEDDGKPCSRRGGWQEWIAMVADAEPERVRSVLGLARDIRLDCKTECWNEIRPKLKIVLDGSGVLRMPGEVLIGPEGDLPPGMHPVSAMLLEDPEMLEILRVSLKVTELEDKVWIKRLDEMLAATRRWGAGAVEWKTFWHMLLASPKDLALKYADEKKNQIKVCDRKGNWVIPSMVLLPGRLVSDDDPANSGVLVDLKAHGDSQEHLRAVRVTDFPEGQSGHGGDWGRDPVMENLNDWLEVNRDTYRKTHSNSARSSYLFPRRFSLPKGWHFLSRLHGPPAAKLTSECLNMIADSRFAERIRFGHCTQDQYPIIEVYHPVLSWVLQFGKVQIGERTVYLSAVVEVAAKGWFCNVPGLACMERAFDRLRRVFDSHIVKQEIRQEFWKAVMSEYVTPANRQDQWVASIWNGAADAGVYPVEFPSCHGGARISEVFVTTSKELADRVTNDEQLVFVISQTTLELWVSKGAKRLADWLTPHWEDASPGVSLPEAFPEIQPALSREISRKGIAIRVSGLVMRFNEVSTPIPCLLEEETLYFDGEKMEQMSLQERCTILLNELGNAGILTCSIDDALAKLIDIQVESRRSKVSSGETLEMKLLLAVGCQAAPLRSALGTLGGQSFLQTCSKEELSRVVLRHLGPSVLSSLSATLEAEGLAPPSRWGTGQARDFVRQLGFPEEFGESRTANREPEEFSQGPFPLPPLHDFQIEVRDGIKAMIDKEKNGRRAVISLPTGGGKTRVTVESAVEFTLKPESRRRGVLWIAQTDELCEQAVQAFREVWPNRGAEKTDLRIIRLWGGNPRPSIPEEGDPFVIVASIQTMDARGGIHGGEWTKIFGMIVIDECHHAITPSYTRLLKGLGFDARTNDEGPNPELIILGLSATPFRVGDDESRRLVARFGNRCYPKDQQTLHERLLQQRVLCKVTYEDLQSGVSLSGAEEEELDRLYKPSDYDGIEFERLLGKINQRLGDDEVRNHLLVERIQASNERSILFFANSVSHSYEITARLNLAGIPAAAVSGETSRCARRYFLDQFRQGELRVLCNHSVLTTGFDAPQTDMLLIARQVFSPVRYMQIVGRGLRGVKNGGTEHCRIVTVLDNLGRFQDRHPYQYFRHYFEKCHK